MVGERWDRFCSNTTVQALRHNLIRLSGLSVNNGLVISLKGCQTQVLPIFPAFPTGRQEHLKRAESCPVSGESELGDRGGSLLAVFVVSLDLVEVDFFFFNLLHLHREGKRLGNITGQAGAEARLFSQISVPCTWLLSSSLRGQETTDTEVAVPNSRF